MEETLLNKLIESISEHNHLREKVLNMIKHLEREGILDSNDNLKDIFLLQLSLEKELKTESMRICVLKSLLE